MLNECNGCEYQCNLSHIDICTLGSPCPNQRSTPMTEQEWLQTCNTEQLAEAIYYLTWFHTELDERLDKNVKNGCYNDDENIKIVMEWLKQPHTPKE